MPSRSHGHTVNGVVSKEYLAYRSMLARCYNTKTINYHLYGGRGISVCNRWLESFGNFIKDVGLAPSKHHQIDRINNDGRYEPKNVRWATPGEQARNRRSTKLITCNGKTMASIDWSRELGGDDNLVRRRIKRGWSAKKAVTTPVNKNKIRKDFR